MAHQLRALVSLAEYLGSASSTPTHDGSQVICNSSSRGSNDPFWPLQAPGTHKVHTQAQGQNIHTHIK